MGKIDGNDGLIAACERAGILPDELHCALRRDLQRCRRQMRKLWMVHLGTLKDGDGRAIARTRSEYDVAEYRFESALAALEGRERLLRNDVGVGDRVRLTGQTESGCVIGIDREFRVWWACGRKWAEMQNRYRVETDEGEVLVWMDEMSVGGRGE